MGHLGGKAKAASLSPAERSESARHAVNARWAKQKILDQRGAIGMESLPVVLDPDQTKLNLHSAEFTSRNDSLDSIWFGGD